MNSVNGSGCFPQAGYVTFFFPLFLHPGLQLALTHFVSVRNSNGKQYNWRERARNVMYSNRRSHGGKNLQSTSLLSSSLLLSSWKYLDHHGRLQRRQNEDDHEPTHCKHGSFRSFGSHLRHASGKRWDILRKSPMAYRWRVWGGALQAHSVFSRYIDGSISSEFGRHFRGTLLRRVVSIKSDSYQTKSKIRYFTHMVHFITNSRPISVRFQNRDIQWRNLLLCGLVAPCYKNRLLTIDNNNIYNTSRGDNNSV